MPIPRDPMPPILLESVKDVSTLVNLEGLLAIENTDDALLKKESPVFNAGVSVQPAVRRYGEVPVYDWTPKISKKKPVVGFTLKLPEMMIPKILVLSARSPPTSISAWSGDTVTELNSLGDLPIVKSETNHLEIDLQANRKIATGAKFVRLAFGGVIGTSLDIQRICLYAESLAHNSYLDNRGIFVAAESEASSSSVTTTTTSNSEGETAETSMGWISAPSLLVSGKGTRSVVLAALADLCGRTDTAMKQWFGEQDPKATTALVNWLVEQCSVETNGKDLMHVVTFLNAILQMHPQMIRSVLKNSMPEFELQRASNAGLLSALCVLDPGKTCLKVRKYLFAELLQSYLLVLKESSVLSRHLMSLGEAAGILAANNQLPDTLWSWIEDPLTVAMQNTKFPAVNEGALNLVSRLASVDAGAFELAENFVADKDVCKATLDIISATTASEECGKALIQSKFLESVLTTITESWSSANIELLQYMLQFLTSVCRFAVVKTHIVQSQTQFLQRLMQVSREERIESLEETALNVFKSLIRFHPENQKSMVALVSQELTECSAKGLEATPSVLCKKLLVEALLNTQNDQTALVSLCPPPSKNLFTDYLRASTLQMRFSQDDGVFTNNTGDEDLDPEDPFLGSGYIGSEHGKVINRVAHEQIKSIPIDAKWSRVRRRERERERKKKGSRTDGSCQSG
eukprot:TRINITY_DN3040_c0_g2_i2.p1 TRINITY_DN3040_c0_g2~~TRINITY_DN3040_c0_g2_i2.p1  ORF type:complete len:719 (-),score=219.91 TRINITY_DN3040_c0_g2_i2:3388-5454(-)